MGETAAELLVHLLFSRGSAAAGICEAIAASEMWAEVIDKAACWRVLPHLVRGLAGASLEPSPEQAAVLRRQATASLSRSALAARTGVAAMKALAAGGYPAAVFKGCAAMASLYGDPARRTVRDADILISPDHLKPALACLRSAGLTPDLECSLEEYASFISRSPAFAGNLGISLHSSGGYEVDLHWQLGISWPGFSTTELIARAQTTTLFGAEIAAVAPCDAMILTAHHAFRENLAPAVVLRDVIDIAEWCEKLSARGDLLPHLRCCAEYGSSLQLLVLTSIASEWGQSSPAAEAREFLLALTCPEEHRAARSLVSLFAAQVRRGSLNPDLCYLAYPRSLRQIAASMLIGWSRHRNLMKLMEKHLDGQPRPLGSRLRDLCRCVASLSPVQASMIRTLAKVKETYRAT